MNYEEFKEYILRALREHYGEERIVTVERMTKKNNRHPEGICARKKNNPGRVTPVIYLEELYRNYQEGMELEACIKDVCERIEDTEYLEEMEKFAERIEDWQYVKEHVYPVLLSTEGNQELLKSLISTPMLDLSVIYSIRLDLKEKGSADVKVNEVLLRLYGISREELHQQALCNMEQDGYRVQSMAEMLKEMCPFAPCNEEQGEKEKDENEPPMYVLTNRDKKYGAAGILNWRLLQEFAGGRSFYILPSSCHETIFIPAEMEGDPKILDHMVADINRTEVLQEERLSNHSYYYDGEAGDIRLCA